MVSHSFEIPQGESIPEFLEKPHPLTAPLGKWHLDNHFVTKTTKTLSQDQKLKERYMNAMKQL